jgi:choline-sulfatase
MKRPNFLVIQADQLTAKVLSMYGGRVAKTPNMDALAKRGVTFLNSYCNNPVCGPSRASMMTGQLSSTIGCYDNAGELLSSIPTFAHYLRFLDYRTCLAGKMHFVGADQLHGFEERITTDIYPSDYGWTADWTQQEEPYAPSRMSLRSIVEAGLCKRSLQLDYDEEVCHVSVQKLYDYARDPDQRPFLLFASFTHPHNPFVTTAEFWNLYDHHKIDLPDVPHIPIAERDPWSQRYAYTIREDEHDVSEAQLRNARHAYYAMVSYFDSLIGRLLKALDDGGLAANTYVFVIADHGEMLGERGTWFKFLPYEGSTRVPMVVAGPSVKRGHVERKGVSLVDLLPTLLDLATDGKPPALVDPIAGRTLAAMLTGDGSGRADDVMIEYTGEGVYAPALMLRQDGMKYVHCRTDPPMLFDLNKDPLELKNVADDPAYAKVGERLKGEIDRRWNYSALERDILASQKRRLFVQQALLKGKWTGWDHQPLVDATRAYVRGAVDPSTTATKARRRLPFVAEVAPDHPRRGKPAIDLKPRR